MACLYVVKCVSNVGAPPMNSSWIVFAQITINVGADLASALFRATARVAPTRNTRVFR